MSSARVVVLGYVVRGPLGGLAWHHLQFALGLAQLGHDVWYLEDSDDYPSCYDPTGHGLTTDPTYGVRFAADAFDRVGLGSRWAYDDAHRGVHHGPAAGRWRELASTADVVLNVSGVNPLRHGLEHVPRRVLIDTDPVFTQIKHLRSPAQMAAARAHTDFFTFGETWGAPACRIPDDGLPWRPTRQPVVLDQWRPTDADPDAAFTTVMQWDSYAAQAHAGETYGMKSTTFAEYERLPSLVGERLELALGGETAPVDRLRRLGWRVRDAREPTVDPWTYQRYLRGSKGELSVAKGGYVRARSGWFSERSAAYLASGRPVITQDTGFSTRLPVGRGLLAFSSLAEAVEHLGAVSADHRRHCRAARELAAAHFDARDILPPLLDGAGRAMAAAAPSPSRRPTRTP